VKTARHEWKQASVKAIDLDVGRRPSNEPAEDLVSELLNGGDAVEVGLPEGSRYTFETMHETLGSGTPLSLGASDVVVASGGARGVTAACLLELGRRTGASFLLLGRTPLVEESPRLKQARTDGEVKKAIILDAREAGEIIKPAEVGRRAARVHSGREVRHTLAQFEAVGARARYAAADVRDVAALSAEIAVVREDWGPITVLVHGAGVLADKLLVDKTMDQFDRVFGTKVYGFYSLLAATAQDPLRAIAMFSSAAARSGNAGQSDYAMANEVLNKLAQAEARRRDECVVKSFGWGPWKGGMVTPTLEALFTSRGVELIDVADGAAAFADEMLGGDDDIEVLFGEVDFGTDDRAPVPADVELPEPAKSRATFSYHVDADTHPWLTDHTVGGTPVLPLVIVMDWFVRAAREIYPGVPLTRLRDIKVLKGVRFEDLDESMHLEVHARAVQNGLPRVQLALVGAGGTKHYEGVAELGMSAPPFAPPVFSHERAWRGTVYDGEALFHGPKFQTVEKVYDLNDGGVTADVTPGSMLGWEIEDGGVDPAGLDACLQLVLLWMRAVRDGVALPMSVGSVELHTDAWPAEPLEARFDVRHADGHHAVGDLWLRTKDGEPLATLRELKTFVYKRI
jgi:NAD(P)-dependent dehydrogenase (short-subunit alcohol dehydrogenase family)